ncbi:MAG: N-acetylneuraminate synthase [Ignavibacteriales bacterium]|nr:N-acetylneuraminate synthase [Ignavibacteriales bacterium]
MLNFQRVIVIAEAGVNHNGSLDIAFRLIDEAVEAGADIVKFQTFRADREISWHALKAEYQKETTDAKETQLEMARKLEFDIKDHRTLINYCKQKGIRFLSTPFDLESIQMLADLGLGMIKVPSGEITNLPYLRALGRLCKPVIMSTGMADLGEIEDALNILIDSGTSTSEITLLQCNTEYPTPYPDVNLRAMVTLREAFKLPVGYSDHTLGIEVPIAAVALGASVIEKHLTLNKNMLGPDHRASLEPAEFKCMVSAIRNIEVALGSGIKKASESEKKNKNIARKSIVADRPIKAGEMFTETNLTTKRPGTGISPMLWDWILGRNANKDYDEDELLTF